MRDNTKRLWEQNRYHGSQTQGPCGRVAMAKPEVFHSVGFGRTERRITFESKASALCGTAKRSETRGIAAVGDHIRNPLERSYGAA
jgi:hypothetical protein